MPHNSQLTGNSQGFEGGRHRGTLQAAYTGAATTSSTASGRRKVRLPAQARPMVLPIPYAAIDSPYHDPATSSCSSNHTIAEAIVIAITTMLAAL